MSKQADPPDSFFCSRRAAIFVILFTGAFTGMVLGLQGYYTLRKFGSEGLLGSAVALSLIRELGPVLAALMVIGRAGSAICAEIGIMRNSEQIDALECMAIDPFKFLMAPKFLAAVISLPLLTGIFDVVGIGGGYLIGVKLLGVNDGAFFLPDTGVDGREARLTAFVVAPGMSREQLLEILRNKIDAVFLPRPLYIVPSLPRNDTGKLPRNNLVSLHQQQQAIQGV